MSLRGSLIRLAHAEPSLRSHLLPLLTKTARAPKWTKTVAGPDARIRWADHPENAILIEELPSKGKKRLRRAEWSVSEVFSPSYLPNAFLMTNLMRDMHPSPSMSYDQAVAAFKKAIKLATESVDSGQGRADWQDKIAPWQRERLTKWTPNEGDVFYLEVEPADYEPMTMQGKDFAMSVEWGEFKAYSPDSDFQQSDPHYTLYAQKSAGGARKLYKILKANPDALRSVSWRDLSDWFRKVDVAYDTHFSSWR